MRAQVLEVWIEEELKLEKTHICIRSSMRTQPTARKQRGNCVREKTIEERGNEKVVPLV